MKASQNQTKKFGELSIFFKGSLFYYYYYYLSEKFVCVPWGLIPGRTTLKFEYLREFGPEFKNVFGYELEAHMGSIYEKNQGPKNLCYCTFKPARAQ
jgi:hypothetical protein